MKIKLGKITEDVSRMTNEIYKNTSPSERLSIDLKDTCQTVAEIDERITSNLTDTIVFMDDDGTEETFNGYVFDNVRKSYDDIGKRLSIEFTKLEENVPEK